MTSEITGSELSLNATNCNNQQTITDSGTYDLDGQGQNITLAVKATANFDTLSPSSKITITGGSVTITFSNGGDCTAF